MLPLLQLLLPEVAAHHRVAVLVDAVTEVLAGFQEKSLNPIYVRTRTLLTPMQPYALCLSRGSPAPIHWLPARTTKLLALGQGSVFSRLVMATKFRD